MTPREHAAFTAGLRHAAELARVVALTIECRPDAAEMRERAAAQALHGLADGLSDSSLEQRIDTSSERAS